MLRVYFTSLLLSLLAVACGQKKRSATAGEKPVASHRFPGLIPDKLVGYTSDFAHQYSGKEIRALDSMIAMHEVATGNQVSIVTLNLDSTQVNSYEEFDSLTLGLTQHWGIGKKGKNNGVAIVIAPRLRMIRIHVGTGLEEKLTDAECRAILDESMFPLFRNGEFYQATWTGLRFVLNEIR